MEVNKKITTKANGVYIKHPGNSLTAQKSDVTLAQTNQVEKRKLKIKKQSISGKPSEEISSTVVFKKEKISSFHEYAHKPLIWNEYKSIWPGGTLILQPPKIRKKPLFTFVCRTVAAFLSSVVSALSLSFSGRGWPRVARLSGYRAAYRI